MEICTSHTSRLFDVHAGEGSGRGKWVPVLGILQGVCARLSQRNALARIPLFCQAAVPTNPPLFCSTVSPRINFLPSPPTVALPRSRQAYFRSCSLNSFPAHFRRVSRRETLN